MKNLRLIPDTHRHEPIVKARFAYDRGLIALIKSQKGRCTLESNTPILVFFKKRFSIKFFLSSFKRKSVYGLLQTQHKCS